MKKRIKGPNDYTTSGLIYVGPAFLGLFPFPNLAVVSLKNEFYLKMCMTSVNIIVMQLDKYLTFISRIRNFKY